MNELAEDGLRWSVSVHAKFGCPNNGIFLDKLSNSTAQEAFCTSKNFVTVSLLTGYKILL